MAQLLKVSAIDAAHWFSSTLYSQEWRGRDPRLAPRLTMPTLIQQHPTSDTHLWKSIDEAVRYVAKARNSILESTGLRYNINEAQQQLAKGRWMAYDPAGTDFGGLAAIETHSIFDEADCPGWEMWVGCLAPRTESHEFFQRSLIAWVPPQFLRGAEGAMQSMSGSAAIWADDHAGVAAKLFQTVR